MSQKRSPGDWRKSIHVHFYAPTLASVRPQPAHNQLSFHKDATTTWHNSIGQSSQISSSHVGSAVTTLLPSLLQPTHNNSLLPCSPRSNAHPRRMSASHFNQPSHYTPASSSDKRDSQLESVHTFPSHLPSPPTSVDPTITAAYRLLRVPDSPFDHSLRVHAADFPLTFGDWNEKKDGFLGSWEQRAAVLKLQKQRQQREEEDEQAEEQRVPLPVDTSTSHITVKSQQSVEKPLRHAEDSKLAQAGSMNGVTANYKSKENYREAKEQLRAQQDDTRYLTPSTNTLHNLLHQTRSSGSGFAGNFSPTPPLALYSSSTVSDDATDSHILPHESPSPSSITHKETFCSFYSDNDYGDCWQEELRSGWHYGLVIDFHSRKVPMFQDNTSQEESIQLVELYTAERGRCFIPTTRSRIADKARNTEMVRFKQEEDSQLCRIRPPCFHHMCLQGTWKVRPGRLLSFRPVGVCSFHRLPLHQAAERQLTLSFWVDQIGMLDVDARLCLKLQSRNSHTAKAAFFEALRLLYLFVECAHNENPQTAITPAQWRVTNAQIISEESNGDSTPDNCWPLIAQRHDDLTFRSFNHTETPWQFRSAQFPDRCIWARDQQIVNPETCMHSRDKFLSAVIVPIHFGPHKGTWQCLVIGLKQEVLNVSNERLLNFKSVTLHHRHRAGSEHLQQRKNNAKKNFKLAKKEYIDVNEELMENCPEEMRIVWEEIIPLPAETNR